MTAWRAWVAPLLLLALLVAIAAAWYEGRQAGEYAVRFRAADSLLHVKQSVAAKTETTYVTKRDTVRVAITRLRTLRDTLNIHDTVQVMHYTWLSDSIASACTEALSACDSTRAAKDAVIAAQNAKIKLLLHQPRAPRVPSCVAGAGIGTAGALELAVTCGVRLH